MTASFDSALRFSFGIIERTKYMKRTQGIMQAPDKKQSGQVVRKTTPPETNLPDGKAGLASKIAMYVDGQSAAD